MSDMTLRSSRLELLYLTNCLIRLVNSSQFSRVDLLVAIEAATTLLEARKSNTRGHSSEVAFVAAFIADRLGLPPREQDRIKLAALVHDIGKIKREEYPGQHALLGAQIIRCIPQMDEVADMVLFHHTCWQGVAHSALQAGTSVPLGARIIAVADAFQRCLAHCQGNRILGNNDIRGELRSQAKSGLDPSIVDIAVENYELLSRFVG